MEFNKDISNKVRGLANLGVGPIERREIIKTSYCCLMFLRGFPEVLEESIEEAKAKKLTGKDAYALIDQNFNEYQNELINKQNIINPQEDYMSSF